MIAALSACSISPSWPIQEYFKQSPNDAKYEQRCGEAQKSQDSDLCQQWRMAVAAENMRDLAAVQTGIVTLALFFSIWAAIASSRQARAAEEQLASTDRAHLLVHFNKDGLLPVILPDDYLRLGDATEWKLHNYGDTVAFIRWRHAQHAFLPEPEIPAPIDWRKHVGGSTPFGVVAPPKDDTVAFTTKVSDSVSSRTMEKHKADGRCFFQGFVAERTTPPAFTSCFSLMLLRTAIGASSARAALMKTQNTMMRFVAIERSFGCVCGLGWLAS